MMLEFLLAAAMQPSVCQPISSDRIYGRDLAAARPAFTALPPDLPVGFAPLPGLERVFHPAELRHIAQANHLRTEISGDTCFAWVMAAPSREIILMAMNRALQGRQVRLEILEQSLSPAPKGELVFPLSGLSGFSAEPVVWRGYVVYAANRRFDIWARVRISVQENHLIAREPLHAGQLVRETQLDVQGYQGPLSRQNPLTDLDQAIGMIPRFDVSMGTVLTKALLSTPSEVERGDTVDVIVQTDGTRIEAQGIAEQAGRAGAVITIRNAKTGRKFRARIEGKGKVLVVPGGPVGLVGEESKS
jgi:flagella basal body P-ring formation protein FlgA